MLARLAVASIAEESRLGLSLQELICASEDNPRNFIGHQSRWLGSWLN